jgi:ParB-like chromosome segregation protein Spo0J
LLPGESPRLDGVDEEYAARLASLETPLPPILVRRCDMTVIDGRHRLLAALLRGQQRIEVEFFEGSDADAFLRAVEANVTHGRPLSLADRRAAAARIIASHPHLSTRAIARASGLSAKAVAAVRSRSTGAGHQLNKRVGQDGRARPVNVMEGRWRAARVMAENPDASLREIARLAGISPATASDVRKRILAGEPPVAMPARTGGAHPDGPEAGRLTAVQSPPGAQETGRGDAVRDLAEHARPESLLGKLSKDPALRLREEGRGLLRLLQYNALAEWSGLSAAVPRHCEPLVGRLARQYAAQWLEFAQDLEKRDIAAAQRRTG